MPKKKSLKRKRSKYPGLDKRLFSKIKQEFHDIDYAHKLTDKQKEWLSTFMEEDLGARMNHPGKKIYKSDKDRKGSFGRNNSRNRDVYAISRAQGKVFQVYQEAINEYLDTKYLEATPNPEDDLIELLDKSKLLEGEEDGEDTSGS